MNTSDEGENVLNASYCLCFWAFTCSRKKTEKYNTESATKVKYENVTAENERRTADKEKLMYSGKLRTNFSLGWRVEFFFNVPWEGGQYFQSIPVDGGACFFLEFLNIDTQHKSIAENLTQV